MFAKNAVVYRCREARYTKGKEKVDELHAGEALCHRIGIASLDGHDHRRQKERAGAHDEHFAPKFLAANKQDKPHCQEECGENGKRIEHIALIIRENSVARKELRTGVVRGVMHAVMVRRILMLLLAFVLTFGVLGFLSPLHDGMSHDEPAPSVACMLLCLTNADHGTESALVLPLLVLVVALAVVVMTLPAAPPVLSGVVARAGPISPYCARYALSVCKRE